MQNPADDKYYDLDDGFIDDEEVDEPNIEDLLQSEMPASLIDPDANTETRNFAYEKRQRDEEERIKNKFKVMTPE